jgi:hypothetical protein
LRVINECEIAESLADTDYSSKVGKVSAIGICLVVGLRYQADVLVELVSGFRVPVTFLVLDGLGLWIETDSLAA